MPHLINSSPLVDPNLQEHALDCLLRAWVRASHWLLFKLKLFPCILDRTSLVLDQAFVNLKNVYLKSHPLPRHVVHIHTFFVYLTHPLYSAFGCRNNKIGDLGLKAVIRALSTGLHSLEALFLNDNCIRCADVSGNNTSGQDRLAMELVRVLTERAANSALKTVWLQDNPLSTASAAHLRRLTEIEGLRVDPLKDYAATTAPRRTTAAFAEVQLSFPIQPSAAALTWRGNIRFPVGVWDAVWCPGRSELQYGPGSLLAR